jgi:Tol biopolymer transport system component
MRYVLLGMVMLVQATPSAPPDTEVFLATLTIRGGQLDVGKPVNISNNPGYDNQPSFTPDGAAILFTSVRGGRKPDPKNSAATGSDIYRYDLKTQQVVQLTDTPEAEYSPTVTPDGRYISVVRVEADNTQRLWRFDIAGRNPELVLADVKPVGYHAWADSTTLALFVLGKPATLQLADTRTGKAQVQVKGIGRSIQRIPGGGGISFVLRETTDEGQPVMLTIRELQPGTGETRSLVRAPTGATEADTAWTPDGMLVVSVQDKLYSWRRGEGELTLAADLTPLGLKGVTRLSVSPKGDRLAIVAQKP